MGRPLPRPKKIDGRIGFMPTDGVFIGARDIQAYVPLRVRIVEVVEYPAGTPIGGRASKEPFPALIFEHRIKGKDWTRATKPMRLNITNHMTLFARFGERAEWWAGREVTLDLAPTRNPTGGRPVAGIVIAPEQDEQTEEQVAAKLARALRHECPYQAPEREPGADEDEPPPSDTAAPLSDDHPDI